MNEPLACGIKFLSRVSSLSMIDTLTLTDADADANQVRLPQLVQCLLLKPDEKCRRKKKKKSRLGKEKKKKKNDDVYTARLIESDSSY